jgi:hypothetical protein
LLSFEQPWAKQTAMCALVVCIQQPAKDAQLRDARMLFMRMKYNLETATAAYLLAKLFHGVLLQFARHHQWIILS